MAAPLRADPAFDGCALLPATREDEDALFALHRDALREYVEQTWGWNDAWQRAHFADNYIAARNALIVRTGREMLIGRISLSRHWRQIFLRDIELIAPERNRGIGSAVIRAVLALAREHNQVVELLVLNCNPARHLYTRLGFSVVGDDGTRMRMRAH